MSEIASSIKNAFKEELMKLDWLDNQSRLASIEKVDAIIEQIAYPDQIFNDSYLNYLYDDVCFTVETLNLSFRANFQLCMSLSTCSTTSLPVISLIMDIKYSA